MSPELDKLFQDFVRKHNGAVQAARSETISDARRVFSWSESHKAEQALVDAIERLEARAAANPFKETIDS